MKILVTGGTGVYGRDLITRLSERGHDVVAMARNTPSWLPPGVRFHAGNVSNPDDVATAMSGCDTVAHLAFVVTPMQSEADRKAINIEGTRNVLDAMERTGCGRLVFASSILVYGCNPDNEPIFHEDSVRRPTPGHTYAEDKLLVEDMIMARAPETVLVRPGPTGGRHVDNIMAQIWGGPAVLGIREATLRWQIPHQEDIGRFLALACEGGPAGPVNVAPADEITLPEVAEILGKHLVLLPHRAVISAVERLWARDLVDITPAEAKAIAYMPKVDTTKMREEWNFHPAWTTREAVTDLRGALRGVLWLGRKEYTLPWRIRYPQYRRSGRVDEVGGSRFLQAFTYGHESVELQDDLVEISRRAARVSQEPPERVEALRRWVDDELVLARTVQRVGSELGPGRLVARGLPRSRRRVDRVVADLEAIRQELADA